MYTECHHQIPHNYTNREMYILIQMFTAQAKLTLSQQDNFLSKEEVPVRLRTVLYLNNNYMVHCSNAFICSQNHTL